MLLAKVVRNNVQAAWKRLFGLILCKHNVIVIKTLLDMLQLANHNQVFQSAV